MCERLKSSAISKCLPTDSNQSASLTPSSVLLLILIKVYLYIFSTFFTFFVLWPKCQVSIHHLDYICNATFSLSHGMHLNCYSDIVHPHPSFLNSGNSQNRHREIFNGSWESEMTIFRKFLTRICWFLPLSTLTHKFFVYVKKHPFGYYT